jgi:hypothetical protein
MSRGDGLLGAALQAGAVGFALLAACGAVLLGSYVLGRQLQGSQAPSYPSAATGISDAALPRFSPPPLPPAAWFAHAPKKPPRSREAPPPPARDASPEPTPAPVEAKQAAPPRVELVRVVRK